MLLALGAIFVVGVGIEYVGARRTGWSQRVIETTGVAIWFAPVPLLLALKGAVPSSRRARRHLQSARNASFITALCMAVPGFILLFTTGYLLGTILFVFSSLPAAMAWANHRSLPRSDRGS
jgi:hypothetical protein